MEQQIIELYQKKKTVNSVHEALNIPYNEVKKTLTEAGLLKTKEEIKPDQFNVHEFKNWIA